MSLKHSNEDATLEPSKNVKIKPQRQPAKRVVTFKMPGLELDTRLTVFDVEYHVHSAVLKVNSTFSGRFLTRPTKLRLRLVLRHLVEGTDMSGLQQWIAMGRVTVTMMTIVIGIWSVIMPRSVLSFLPR
jgi:hypothetical protein